MKIYDMHIHALNATPDPEGLLAKMATVGIDGGCVFSNWPSDANAELGTDFDARLAEVLAWTRGYEDRLFPVMWIHPYEKDIFENVEKAVAAGVCAFKIICTDFYIYEERPMEVLRKIAALGKPVIFHTGILWDGQVSSRYNRPLNWEALLEIKGLRFSMGHCSWPWIDECIALYGKFMNAGAYRSDTAEMFFDITPGTPEIYRKELLTKLFTLGYDVGDNVMFGTDSTAHIYRTEWPEKWLSLDGEIMDLLGVSRKNREKLYGENLLRFLGKSSDTVAHRQPTPDDSQAWSPVNPDVIPVIKKWYKAFDFPQMYDWDFDQAVKTVPVSDAITTSSPVFSTDDGRRNLLHVLYLCEQLAARYAERGIPEKILTDTLADVPTWTNTHSSIQNTLYGGELSWLKRHLDFKIFRLGRLQFCMAPAEHDIPEANVRAGDPVLEIHIPDGGSMSPEACDDSIAQAREFFATYFPDYHYRCFTCHSWLLDTTLKDFLRPDSNILHFQSRFTITEEEKRDSILRYVFAWNTTRANIKTFPAETSFAAKVKAHILGGGSFYVALGFFC